MTQRNAFQWSIPLGTWNGCQVRLSVYFLLLTLIFCYRWRSLRLGLAFGTLLAVAAVVHELGHLLAVRLKGGRLSEVLAWPLGGLSSPELHGDHSSAVAAALAGPFANLLVCVVVLPVLTLDTPHFRDALHPLRLPHVELAGTLVSDLLVLLFCANWFLILVNLFPIPPLDAGRALQHLLAERVGDDTAHVSVLRFGCAVAVALAVGGLAFNNTWTLSIGAVLVAWILHELYCLQAKEAYEESFMGYDFSQGYTSLERSVPRSAPPQPGLLRRWLQRRQAERRRRQLQRERELEQELDRLLQKVHALGYDALSSEEKRQLHRVSELYRRKTGRQRQR